MGKIAAIVAEFHRSISPERFKEMQRKAREAYETFLRIDRYTPFLMQTLKELAKRGNQ